MQGTDIFESASNLDSLHIRNHVVTLLMFPGGDEGEDIDLLIYIDLHQNDLDDLREEYQPNLRQRFDGWIQHKATGSSILLAKLLKAVDLMPWLRGFDAVTEIRTRYATLADLHFYVYISVTHPRCSTGRGIVQTRHTTHLHRAHRLLQLIQLWPTTNGPPPPLPFPFSVVPRGMKDMD